MLKAYNEGFAKYNIENGNFACQRKDLPGTAEEIEKNDIKLYENYYIEQTMSNKSTIRFFQKSETGQQSLSYERKSSKEGGRDGNRPYVCG